MKPTSLGILDPIGNTPLVPLRRVSSGLSVPVLGKCEYLNPGGSVKDRIALAIVSDAAGIEVPPISISAALFISGDEAARPQPTLPSASRSIRIPSAEVVPKS